MKHDQPKSLKRKTIAVLITLIGLGLTWALVVWLWHNTVAKKEGSVMFAIIACGGASILLGVWYYDKENKEPYSRRLRRLCSGRQNEGGASSSPLKLMPFVYAIVAIPIVILAIGAIVTGMLNNYISFCVVAAVGILYAAKERWKT